MDSSSEHALENGTVFFLNEQRKAALADVDKASFSAFHVKVALVAGIGFFTDAYDIFAISIVSTMLGYVYGKHIAGSDSNFSYRALQPSQDLAIKIASPAGSLLGQLLFGWLADLLGRKRMYGIELTIMIIGTFAQSLSGEGAAVNIIGVLFIWRFIMGIGIGGDYPLSAVIASEFSATRFRGRLMSSVFAAQGWGNLTASIVGFVIVVSCKSTLVHDDPSNLRTIDFMWRLLIGLGCVPGVIALYFRLTIPETPRYTMDIERNVQKAKEDVDNFVNNNRFDIDPDEAAVTQRRVQAKKASRSDFISYFGKWENRKLLIGTCVSWFMLDVAFYSLGLNSNTFIMSIGFQSNSCPQLIANAEKKVADSFINATVVSAASAPAGTSLQIYQMLQSICLGNIIVSVGGLIPGYYGAFLLIDRIGRRPLQLAGFAILAALFVVMGSCYVPLSRTLAGQHAMFFLYCLANFFQNCGPNTTTFVIPGEVFPTRYRSTAHGISAASGRLGAIMAQLALYGLLKHADQCSPSLYTKVWSGFSVFMFFGFLATLLLVETNQKSLEELSNERQENFVEGLPNELKLDQNGLLVISRPPLPPNAATTTIPPPVYRRQPFYSLQVASEDA